MNMFYIEGSNFPVNILQFHTDQLLTFLGRDVVGEARESAAWFL